MEADLVGGAALSKASDAVKALSMMKNLPPGIKVIEGGDAELQAELFEGFGRAMRNGLMMVYVVLAVLFAGLLQPLTILFSLPLSIAGAIVALLITNSAITTPVVIGILMLMGIVYQERHHAGRFCGRSDARGSSTARRPSSMRVRSELDPS